MLSIPDWCPLTETNYMIISEEPKESGIFPSRKELLCKYKVCTCETFEQDPKSFTAKCKKCGKYDPKIVSEKNRMEELNNGPY